MLFLDCKLAPSTTDRSGTWNCGCYPLGQSGPEATSVANQIHDCSSSIRNLYFLPPWPISKHCRIIEGLPTSLNPPPQFSSPSCKPWRCRVCAIVLAKAIFHQGPFGINRRWQSSIWTRIIPKRTIYGCFLAADSQKKIGYIKRWVFFRPFSPSSFVVSCIPISIFRPPPIFFQTTNQNFFYRHAAARSYPSRELCCLAWLFDATSLRG